MRILRFAPVAGVIPMSLLFLARNLGSPDPQRQQLALGGFTIGVGLGLFVLITVGVIWVSRIGEKPSSRFDWMRGLLFGALALLLFGGLGYISAKDMLQRTISEGMMHPLVPSIALGVVAASILVGYCYLAFKEIRGRVRER
jgi:hypothetical protein